MDFAPVFKVLCSVQQSALDWLQEHAVIERGDSSECECVKAPGCVALQCWKCGGVRGDVGWLQPAVTSMECRLPAMETR